MNAPRANQWMILGCCWAVRVPVEAKLNSDFLTWRGRQLTNKDGEKLESNDCCSCDVSLARVEGVSAAKESHVNIYLQATSNRFR